jgi:TDG/mug DNA glycosylase family protein
MPEHGFGFTDLVKRPSARAAKLMPDELVAGAAILMRKLDRFRPRIACFHGVTIYRPIARALAVEIDDFRLGLQPHRIGGTALFVVPNPSPANAHFTPAQQVEWYDRLAEYRAGLR